MDTTIEVAELKAIVAVVEKGSFTAAAEILRTDKAHVSRIVSRLERKLRAQLLVRSTRRLNLTEVGRDIYERATGIINALEDTEAAVARVKDRPSGTLKLTTGPEYGMLVVDGWIASYLAEYPDVSVDAEYTNRVTDIIHEGFDVAIRVGALPDSELSARRLGDVRYGLFASPEYLKSNVAPDDPGQLQDHALVMFVPRGRPAWKLVRERESVDVSGDPRYCANNNISVLNMTLSGAGIAQLPQFMAQPHVERGELKQVLHGWGRTPVPVHAVFSSTRYMTPKLRAFVDLAVKSFR